MTIRPSTPEIITVNSEALQTQIRDLLPSQNGFGSELQASNVITPIIDLTAAAQGTTTPEYVQTAFAFQSNTSFGASTGTADIVNSVGVFRIAGNATVVAGTASAGFVQIGFTNGLTNKILYSFGGQTVGSGSDVELSTAFDFYAFLAAGESVYYNLGTSGGNVVNGSFRQVATGDGTLLLPTGFPV